VVWTNAIGLSVSGTTLTKTVPAGWGNAGASSTKAIASGNGYVDFTVTEAVSARMVGLSHFDVDQSYPSIDFALYATNNLLQVYENGVLRGSFGAYAAGDRLRVAVQAGVVCYLRNGTTFYTSTQTPIYPLLVDAAIYSPTASVNDVNISGLLTDSAPIEPVTWANAIGVSVSRNSLTKTATDGWGNAGASSNKAISGGGFVDFTVNDNVGARMVGFSGADVDQSYTSIDFALYATNNLLQVYEHGSFRGSFGPYAVGDHLQVVIASGIVRYRRNGVPFYTSMQVPSFPLLVDTAIYSSGYNIDQVVLCGESVQTAGECLTLTPDVTSAATAIFGGTAYPGQAAANAFDNTTGTFMSLYTSAGTYVGQDFGATPRKLRRVRLMGTSSFGFNAKLQYSDDGTTWADNGLTVTVPPGNNTWLEYAVAPSGGVHRYWRFLDLGTYAYLQIDEIEMLACAQ